MMQQRNSTFRQIEYGSNDYDAACALRHIVLRSPLGLSLYDEDLSQESDHLHYGLFNDASTLVACAVVVPLEKDLASLRQMAVAEAYQGIGAGRQLIQAIESELVDKGFQQLELHARVTAVPFYQKLGYRVTSEQFTQVGIPHVRMEKLKLSDR